MKKLSLAAAILATSAFAMSSAVMAASGPAVTDETVVTAHYVKPMTVIVDYSAIDFGDVYDDQDVAAVSVGAAVTGEIGETFTYGVTVTGASVTLGGTLTGVTQALDETGDAAIAFTVDIDTANLVADAEISELITVSVNYDAIAETTTTAS
ncbi:MAG: hypothetical protein ACI9W6_001629 [Motiliproteus sp.]|jgi:hypothetical protein